MSNNIASRRASAPFLVGLFLVFGIGALAGFIVWLGATRYFGEFDRYVTYFDVSVEGLEPGSPVKYQGVPVGNIEVIRLAPDGKLIEIEMNISRKMLISKGLRIKQELVGIAGGKFLQLFYPTANSPESQDFPELTFEPTLPVVLAAPSQIEEISRALNQAANNILEIDTRSISEELILTLQAIRQLSSDTAFRRAFVSADTVLHDVSTLITRADNLLLQLDSANIIGQAKQTVALTVASAQGIRSTVDSLAQQIQDLRLAARADTMMARYTAFGDNAQASVQRISARLNQTLLHADETLRQLQQTSRAVRRASAGLSQDIGEQLFNEPEEKREK